MVGRLDDLEHVHQEDRADWRAWLEREHERSPGIWLVTWRKASGRPVLAYDDIVEEALCFGWIDSKAAKVDDDRTRLLLTPRKARSSWSRSNKVRWAAMEASGLVAPAGVAVVDTATADGSWSRLHDVEDLVVPADLAVAFGGHAGRRQQWDDFPPSARRGILEWIVTAKRPDTRARRIDETCLLYTSDAADE